MTWYATAALLCALLLASSASKTPSSHNDTPPSDVTLSITWNAYHKVALGTAILVAGLGLAGLLAFFFPLVAYRVCYFLGGCQNTMDYYVDRLVADEVEGGGKVKRSVDYFEPVLMTLAKAYQKYGDVEDHGRQERNRSDDS